MFKLLFWRPQFALWRPKICTWSPVGARIKKLISDPALRDTMYVKKKFQQKLISVLFEILKDNFYDYLDETMITQEINCKILNLNFFHRCIEQICLSCFWKTKGWSFSWGMLPQKILKFYSTEMPLSVVGAYWNITTVEPLFRAGDTLRTEKNCRDCPLNTV